MISKQPKSGKCRHGSRCQTVEEEKHALADYVKDKNQLKTETY